MSAKSKILAWLSLMAFIALMVAYVFEFHWLGNTFGAGKLIGWSVGIALIVGAFVGWKWQTREEEKIDKVRVWMACLLLPVLFAPLLGSWSNRLLSPHAIEFRAYEIFEVKAFAASRFGFIKGETITPDGYYIFIVEDNNLKRIKSETQSFEGVHRGDMVELPVRKGLWGFETVMLE